MRHRHLVSITLVPFALFAVACGSTLPPKELVTARAEYQSAAQGVAAQQNPAELHVAKQALDVAERSFNDDGDSAATKDFAYIATRKAQLADTTARATLAIKEREAAEREAQTVQASALADARSQLHSTKDQLAQEKSAREAAEKAAARALADLKQLASVTQESRGTVITLSGGVLFASNASTLLPTAVIKLNEVADALIKGNPDSNLVVEGHTDSQGQRQYNLELGQKRADAVKNQLISRGVAADRIKSVGVGPDRPVADNKTAEGRANNRRVEIIVEPPAKR